MTVFWNGFWTIVPILSGLLRVVTCGLVIAACIKYLRAK